MTHKLFCALLVCSGAACAKGDDEGLDVVFRR